MNEITSESKVISGNTEPLATIIVEVAYKPTLTVEADQNGNSFTVGSSGGVLSMTVERTVVESLPAASVANTSIISPPCNSKPSFQGTM